MSEEVKRIAVTGAAGAIGYAALFRIASGQLLGKRQPVELRLLELPGRSLDLLGGGVFMELQDCAFPLLRRVVCTSDPRVAFEGVDAALLIGARPRGKGMERGDLLRANAKIFREQGAALGDVAAPDAKVLVVGNPANTNALIAARFACAGRGRIDPRNVAAMTRLDHNRGVSLLAQRAGVAASAVERFCVWGNHSDTMWPDVAHARINGRPARAAIADGRWLDETFVRAVRKRGSAVIAARGSSSAGSAANAAVEQMRDWMRGTRGAWTSMAVYSDGSYGTPCGLYSSFPVTSTDGGGWRIVQGLRIGADTERALKATTQELLRERDIAFSELGL